MGYIIIPLLQDLYIPATLMNVISCYLVSLMVPQEKHTQTFAAKFNNTVNSIFSKLLSRHLGLTKIILNRTSKRRINALIKKRKLLDFGVPWTIAIIIDSTLHPRSSRHQENVQKFTHGKSWIIGHQWTNIGILINGQFIPLPPIPFYTKEECKRRGIKYKTENEKIKEFIRTLSLKSLFGDIGIQNREIVFMMDSGYDDNKLYKEIIKRKMDFIVSLKSTRVLLNPTDVGRKKWVNINKYFSDGRRVSNSVMIPNSKNKNIRCAIKQLDSNLKGIKTELKLVCSKRKLDKKLKYFSCSNTNVKAKKIIIAYRRRWAIEIFHRDIKSRLGLVDAGVHSFDSLHSHVYLVLIAYILLMDMEVDENAGIKKRQDFLQNKITIRENNKVIQLLTQINGADKVKTQCLSVIEQLKVS